MRFVFATMFLLLVSGIVACDEVETYQTCTGNETCTSEVRTDCRGDRIILICDAENFKCGIDCVDACEFGEYDGYAGECKYDPAKGREVCLCLE
ncbi:MAG TPA: hypothetical protein PKG82_07110 [Myxococcota bacterium]|nr:hypothetical protein [Myxococcota bacterium]